MAKNIISAEVSLYPLREAHLGPAVSSFQAALRSAGLDCTTGPMSTLVVGEAAEVFSALEAAFGEASAGGEVVLRATFSNACPI